MTGSSGDQSQAMMHSRREVLDAILGNITLPGYGAQFLQPEMATPQTPLGASHGAPDRVASHGAPDPVVPMQYHRQISQFFEDRQPSSASFSQTLRDVAPTQSGTVTPRGEGARAAHPVVIDLLEEVAEQVAASSDATTAAEPETEPEKVVEHEATVKAEHSQAEQRDLGEQAEAATNDVPTIGHHGLGPGFLGGPSIKSELEKSLDVAAHLNCEHDYLEGTTKTSAVG